MRLKYNGKTVPNKEDTTFATKTINKDFQKFVFILKALFINNQKTITSIINIKGKKGSVASERGIIKSAETNGNNKSKNEAKKINFFIIKLTLNNL
jgi:hypothetical protein